MKKSLIFVGLLACWLVGLVGCSAQEEQNESFASSGSCSGGCYYTQDGSGYNQVKAQGLDASWNGCGNACPSGKYVLAKNSDNNANTEGCGFLDLEYNRCCGKCPDFTGWKSFNPN